ncbi:hypothetical protein D1BOALGB6SA_7266 [Olavius sp. associated proteobacterium Delta 1]|nr:hypothetical protein D1BOALGB6SA_7266 [Olavius sp. associated proteobacterium Delta 1]
MGLFFFDGDRTDLEFLNSALILIDDIRSYGRNSNITN